MRTTRLLHTLEKQLNQLVSQTAPLAHHNALSARFDHQLFSSQSTQMQPYLDEIKHNFTKLQYAVSRQQLAQVSWLAQRLVDQMAALSRESATWSLRNWDSASPRLNHWQQRRLVHQEYERRLLAMYHEKQQQLAQVVTFTEQQRLAKEVDRYAERLARCRSALEKIESVLTRLTR